MKPNFAQFCMRVEVVWHNAETTQHLHENVLQFKVPHSCLVLIRKALLLSKFIYYLLDILALALPLLWYTYLMCFNKR